MNATLYRPCVSDRGPDDEFGTYMFDRGVEYVRRTGGSRYHRGVDVPIGQGTPLYGSGDGVVVGISQTPIIGYIWSVTVEYAVVGVGSVRVSTQHMSRIDVQLRQRVTARTLLGLSGGARKTMGAGNSSGAHVHIELYLNGALADPDNYLNSRSQLASGGGSSIGEDDMQLTDPITPGTGTASLNDYIFYIRRDQAQSLVQIAALTEIVKSLALGAGVGDPDELVAEIVERTKEQLAPYFASINANIDDQPIEFRVTPAQPD